ncbi:hypothetical protein GQ42DRAFT_160460 [Ramicandelaber brevisporus]|nr:hypothetical protein GQ42DRAFT_160460 [Ramicandelaber brevisporus]
MEQQSLLHRRISDATLTPAFPLCNLPWELIREILCFLKRPDAARVARVCQAFYKVLVPRIWYELGASSNGDSCGWPRQPDLLAKYGHMVKKLNRFPPFLMHIDSSSVFAQEVAAAPWPRHFPCVEDLYARPEQCMMGFLVKFPMMTTLRFDLTELDASAVEDVVRFANANATLQTMSVKYLVRGSKAVAPYAQHQQQHQQQSSPAPSIASNPASATSSNSEASESSSAYTDLMNGMSSEWALLVRLKLSLRRTCKLRVELQFFPPVPAECLFVLSDSLESIRVRDHMSACMARQCASLFLAPGAPMSDKSGFAFTEMRSFDTWVCCSYLPANGYTGCIPEMFPKLEAYSISYRHQPCMPEPIKDLSKTSIGTMFFRCWPQIRKLRVSAPMSMEAALLVMDNVPNVTDLMLSCSSMMPPASDRGLSLQAVANPNRLQHVQSLHLDGPLFDLCINPTNYNTIIPETGTLLPNLRKLKLQNLTISSCETLVTLLQLPKLVELCLIQCTIQNSKSIARGIHKISSGLLTLEYECSSSRSSFNQILITRFVESCPLLTRLRMSARLSSMQPTLRRIRPGLEIIAEL